MKKITILFAITLTSTLFTITSCKKPPEANVTLLLAYYSTTGGSATAHYFSQGLAISVYPPVGPTAGHTFIDGIQPSPAHSLALNIGGISTGTYTLGSGQASYITLTLGSSNQFTTDAPQAWGKIHITEFDNNTKWVKGDFSGTVVNTTTLDTINISQGTFSIQYQ